MRIDQNIIATHQRGCHECYGTWKRIASSVAGISLVGGMLRSCPSFSRLDRLGGEDTAAGEEGPDTWLFEALVHCNKDEYASSRQQKPPGGATAGLGRPGSNGHLLASEPEVNFVPGVGVVVGRPGGEAFEDAENLGAREGFDMAVMEDDVRVAAVAPRGDAATRLALCKIGLIGVGVRVKEDDAVDIGDDGSGLAQLSALGHGLGGTCAGSGPI